MSEQQWRKKEVVKAIRLFRDAVDPDNLPEGVFIDNQIGLAHNGPHCSIHAIPDGWWIVYGRPGHVISMSHAEFMKTYEPVFDHSQQVIVVQMCECKTPEAVLIQWDRPGGAPGNAWQCHQCKLPCASPYPPLTIMPIEEEG